MQFNKFYTIQCLLYWSGGRIGGSKDSIEILAATDNPIIRHPITGLPYIPGSSIKGKIRSWLELSNENERIEKINRKITTIKGEKPQGDDKRELDKWKQELKKWEDRLDGIQNGEPCGCGLESCLICRAFGPHKNTDHSLGPTRLIFRDSKMANKEDIKEVTDLPETKFTVEDIKTHSDDKGLHYVEIKSENIIDRHSGRASDPRQMERVIDGTLFKTEVVIRVFEDDEDKDNKDPKNNPIVNILKKGFNLLEQDYLGGSGSRGYGKVNFYGMKIKTNDEPWKDF